MHPAERRILVSKFYPGPKWKARVMGWTDDEVQRFYDVKIEMDEERRRYGGFRTRNSEGDVSEQSGVG